jgi:flagellar L-ring protein FlgH
MSSIKHTILLLVCCALTACFTNKKPVADDPAYAPTIANNMSIPVKTDGSLYQEAYGLNLFSDRKAHFIGDVITITLSEKTVSKKSSGVAVKKDSDVNFDAGTVLGGVSPQYKGLGLETTMSHKRSFAGDSDADQSNSLEGNITVTVAEILPNGNLIVRGEKWITLSKGDEYIRISGIVRPDDIAPDNTVVSTRLANAKISYSGTGALADAQNMGWLARFFNGTFWPL